MSNDKAHMVIEPKVISQTVESGVSTFTATYIYLKLLGIP